MLLTCVNARSLRNGAAVTRVSKPSSLSRYAPPIFRTRSRSKRGGELDESDALSSLEGMPVANALVTCRHHLAVHTQSSINAGLLREQSASGAGNGLSLSFLLTKKKKGLACDQTLSVQLLPHCPSSRFSKMEVSTSSKRIFSMSTSSTCEQSAATSSPVAPLRTTPSHNAAQKHYAN